MCGITGVKETQMQLIFWFKGLKSSNTVAMDLREIFVLGGAGKIYLVKAVGRIANCLPRQVLREQLVSALGDSRNQRSHPHRSETERFVLVHNGVIENHLWNQGRIPYVTTKGQIDTGNRCSLD